MGSRTDLQKILEELLGSHNVYFQPPESMKLKYPAIVYSLNRIRPTYANNKKYLNAKSYSAILIDKDPESEFVNKLLELDYCQFDRPYQSDGLNHFAFTIYY